MAEETIWTRASRCGSSSCVEVGRSGDAVLVRDTKDPSGPKLAFSRTAWMGFRNALDNGALRQRVTD